MNSRIKQDVHKLFEFWCEVSKPQKGQKVTANNITQSFPRLFDDKAIIKQIPDFAYPCEFENDCVLTYSFVLTGEDSKWRFGFCRHEVRSDTAMVLITCLPWHDTFLRLLGVLGELRRSQQGEFESFLGEAYSKGVPEVECSLKVFYHAGSNYFMFQHPPQFQLPSIPENVSRYIRMCFTVLGLQFDRISCLDVWHNLNLYYNFVDPKNMIAVFAAMLHERRIIFSSSQLDKLSSCTQAANAFLYPMVWQHIFIPLLPMKMKDFLSAPMPYIIGVPEPVLKSMSREELGDVVILNCDNNIFQTPFDDVAQMPQKLVTQLKKQLIYSHKHSGDRVSRIFLGALVQLIGGYRDGTKFSQGQKITWDRDTFMESRPDHLRPFLNKMMELQIFHQFIDERLNMLNTGQGISDEFEFETSRYAEKITKSSKNYKEFLKNVKDKTNPAVRSAVKSVKEGSRGVKTAYKDLKSKLRDKTPPKSQFHTSLPQSSFFTESSSAGQHHSAPNSPVFSMRTQGTDFSFTDAGTGTSTVLRKPHNSQSMIQTSNSQTLNGYTNLSNRYVNINNNHVSKSPTVSPTNSLCSSDMNISQELQNHPLFKPPVVDRSLKPSNSMDNGGLRTVRAAKPIPPPCHKSIQTDVPTGDLCIIDDYYGDDDDDEDDDDEDENDDDDDEDVLVAGSECNEEEDGESEPEEDDDQATTAPSVSNEYLFDSPPDMPSPPIPPKRTQSSGDAYIKLPSNKSCEFDTKSERQTVMSASFVFENNFVNNGSELNTKVQKPISPANKAPIPPPRPKPKELLTSNGTSESRRKLNTVGNGTSAIPTPPASLKTRDLISLDESNTSLEIEDFDPLNQNAKPIPSPVQAANTINRHIHAQLGMAMNTSSSCSSSTNSINAPLAIPNNCQHPYQTYFLPDRKVTSLPKEAASEVKDEDLALLRKYGLDQFTLTTSNSNSSSSSTFATSSPTKTNGNATKTFGKTNWTTFE